MSKNIYIRWKCLKKKKEKSYISVELPDKAREIVVLEVSGKKSRGKCLRIPHNKAVVPSTPRNNMVCVRILNEVISFCKERWRTRVMKSLHRLRRLNHRRG